MTITKSDFEAIRKEERKLIVKWIREEAKNVEKDLKNAVGAVIAGSFDAIADAIEKGK